VAGRRFIRVGLLGVAVEDALREPLVKVGTLALRDPSVRRVGHEAVFEPPALAARVLGAGEALRLERVERRSHLARRALAEADDDGLAEAAALDRRELGDVADRRVQAVEARGEERLHRRRDLDVDIAVGDPAAVGDRAAVAEHRRDLAEEQRVALGGLADAVDDRRRRAAELVLGEPARVLGRERRQRDRERARHPRAPRRSLLEQLGAREAEHHGPAAEPLHHGLDEVEQRRLGPVHVLQHREDRALAGERLEESAHRPRRVRRRRLPDAEHLREPRGDGRAVGRAGEPLVEHARDRRSVGGRRPRDPGEQVDERRERHAVAVRGRLPDEHARAIRDRIGERVGEPGLPDARRCEHRDEDARIGLDRLLERVLEHRERPVASDERGVGGPRDGSDAEDARGAEDLGLALQGEGFERLRLEGSAGEPLGALGHEHVAGRSGGLEPCRGVEHVASDAALARGGDVREHLTRVDRDPHAQRFTVGAQGPGGVAHLERGAGGADDVVLVCGRDAEDADDCVADELLDLAPVPLDRRAHRREVPVERRPERLGVDALAELGRSDEVTEQRGDEPPPRGALGLEPLAALRAEAGALDLVPAGRAPHRPSVTTRERHRNPR
jgi:hypothetical protein